MVSGTTACRQGRAAVWGLLFVGAVVGQAEQARAQRHNDTGEFANRGAAVFHDARRPTPCYDDGAEFDFVNACEQCCRKRRIFGWIGAEYLRWELDGSRLPPLVTDGPATTPLDDVAQLDDLDTRILSGNETVNGGWRDGYRLFGGFWFDRCHMFGIGGEFFEIGSDDHRFTSPLNPERIVGRPFFNTVTGENDAQFLFVPNQLNGTADVRANDDFEGAGVLFHQMLWRCNNPCYSGYGSGICLLSGYQYYRYDSDMSVTERLTVLPDTTTPLVPGTTFHLQDSFRASNTFHGSEIGLQARILRRWWWFDGMAKVAMGSQRRVVTVDGQTTIDVPGGGSFTGAGGLLASEVTNIGRYDDADFVFIPEFRLGAGVKLTRQLSVRAGYNLILWGDVASAAAHLPAGLAVDARNLPPVLDGGGSDPAFPGVHGSQLVAHGFDANVMWIW